MKDQVQNLKKRGIKQLDRIYFSMSRQEIIVTLENCIFGNFKFLYISPERLDTEIFRTKLQKTKISMITVDESHCISQWGYDFRPAYLKIAEIRELLPAYPSCIDSHRHSGSSERYPGPSAFPWKEIVSA